MVNTAPAHASDHAAGHHDHPTGLKRYLYSTNHKDIGFMYLWFAAIAGVIGFLMSVAIRVELAEPGVQFLPLFTGGDAAAAHQLYNVLITGPTGCGKTYLGCVLATQACRHGLSVRYFRTSRLLEALSIAHGDGRCTKLIVQLAMTGDWKK